MNYLAQGIQQGAQIGAAAYEARKRRDQEAALEKARREMQLELDTRRTAAERALQEERLVADAKRQFSDQNFRKEEGATERGWRSGERASTQKFSAKQGRKERNWRSAESALDRDARAALQREQLDEAAGQFAKKYEQQDRSLLRQEERDARGTRVDELNPDTGQIERSTLRTPFTPPAGPALTPAAAAATPPRKGTPPQPPEQAIKFLRANPQTAAAFDELFGRGAAARILGSR